MIALTPQQRIVFEFVRDAIRAFVYDGPDALIESLEIADVAGVGAPVRDLLMSLMTARQAADTAADAAIAKAASPDLHDPD